MLPAHITDSIQLQAAVPLSHEQGTAEPVVTEEYTPDLEVTATVADDLMDYISPYDEEFQERIDAYGQAYVDEYLREAPKKAGEHHVNGYLYHDMEDVKQCGQEFARYFKMTQPINRKAALDAGNAFAQALRWQDLVDDGVENIATSDLLSPHLNEDLTAYLTNKTYDTEYFSEHRGWIGVFEWFRVVEDELGLAPSDPTIWDGAGNIDTLDEEFPTVRHDGFAWNMTKGFRYHSVAVESDTAENLEPVYEIGLHHMSKAMEVLTSPLITKRANRLRYDNLFIDCVILHDDPDSGYRRLLSKDEAVADETQIVKNTQEMATLLLTESVEAVTTERDLEIRNPGDEHVVDNGHCFKYRPRTPQQWRSSPTAN